MDLSSRRTGFSVATLLVPNEGALGRPTEKPQPHQRVEHLAADNRIKLPQTLHLAPGEKQTWNLEILPAMIQTQC